MKEANKHNSQLLEEAEFYRWKQQNDFVYMLVQNRQPDAYWNKTISAYSN